MRGIEADGSDPVALISEGIRLGEFRSHEHTLRNWRRELMIAASVIDRSGYREWEADGGRPADERAAAEVERLLRRDAVPLAPDVAAVLDEIMNRETAAWS